MWWLRNAVQHIKTQNVLPQKALHVRYYETLISLLRSTTWKQNPGTYLQITSRFFWVLVLYKILKFRKSDPLGISNWNTPQPHSPRWATAAGANQYKYRRHQFKENQYLNRMRVLFLSRNVSPFFFWARQTNYNHSDEHGQSSEAILMT